MERALRLMLVVILMIAACSASAGPVVRGHQPLPEGPRWTKADKARGATQLDTPHGFHKVQRAAGVVRSGRLLVRLKAAGESARVRALTRLAPIGMAEPMPGLWSVRVTKGTTEEELADALLATGDYEWAEPDWRLMPAAEPNDPLIGEQYHHGATAMNTLAAWNLEGGDPSVTIAIVDTGVDKSHPDLGGLLEGYNAIDRLTESQGGDVSPITSHGTWVMGAAGARGNNEIGVAGTGWGFGLLPVRVSNQSDGSALTSEIVHAATWASEHGADIVNVSYDGSWASAAGELGALLRQRGVLLVWAAGNLGAPIVTADWPGVTIVSATSKTNRRWTFSNTGVGVDVAAPGVSVLTTDVGGGYLAVNGTSLAAPLVSGALGLIWSADPNLTAGEVEQVLLSTATDLGSTGRDTSFGWGLADVAAAVSSVQTGPVRLPIPFRDPLNAVLDRVAWPEAFNAQIWTGASEEPTGESSVLIGAGGSLSSAMFQAGGGEGMSVRWYASAAEAGDAALTLSYTDSAGDWHELSRTLNEGFESQRFGWHAATLPPQAWHDGLRVRFSVPTWSAGVSIDSVAVEASRAIDPPWRESFDQGHGSPSVTLTGGAAVVRGVPSASGDSVLRLGEGSAAESLKVLTLIKWGLTGVADAQLGAWVRPIDGSGSIVIEAEGFVGWQVVGTISSEGMDTGRMTRWEMALPGWMLFPGDSPIRLRAQGGAWDLDDLFVRRGVPEGAAGCEADLNQDGFADVADLIAFASMYASGDAGADVTGDGVVDLQDALGFVENYALECD